MSTLPADEITLTNSDNSQFTGGSSVSLRDEFIIKNPKETIEGIIESYDEGRCVTLTTIDSISTTTKWYYISCKACNKIVDPYPENSGDDGKPPTYLCTTCEKDVTDVAIRYRLLLDVTDELESYAKFVLFDVLCQKLLNRSAPIYTLRFLRVILLYYPVGYQKSYRKTVSF